MKASLKRETKETSIRVSVELEGSGECDADTGIQLLDETVCMLAVASKFDIAIKARGDLEIGDHHTSEDVGICLGGALAKLIKRGIGSSTVPLGDCLAIAAVSFGEPRYCSDFEFGAQEIGGMALENFGHFCRSMAYNGRFTLHLRAEGGDDRRKIDAMTTALGRALRRAFDDGQLKNEK